MSSRKKLEDLKDLKWDDWEEQTKLAQAILEIDAEEKNKKFIDDIEKPSTSSAQVEGNPGMEKLIMQLITGQKMMWDELEKMKSGKF